jgi:hypothetical protein
MSDSLPIGPENGSLTPAQIKAEFRRTPWLVREALFALVDIVGRMKDAAIRGESEELRSAVAGFRRWQDDYPESVFGSALCYWATIVWDLRPTVFHFTPATDCPWLSYDTAVYALYNVAGDILWSRLELARHHDWSPEQQCQELCAALATFDQGFFTRELQFEFKLLEKNQATWNPQKKRPIEREAGSGPKTPGDGEVDSVTGEVWLRGQHYRFGPEQRRLLLWLLKHRGQPVNTAVQELNLTDRQHFDVTLRRLRETLVRHFAAAPHSLVITVIDGQLDYQWVERGR